MASLKTKCAFRLKSQRLFFVCTFFVASALGLKVSFAQGSSDPLAFEFNNAAIDYSGYKFSQVPIVWDIDDDNVPRFDVVDLSNQQSRQRLKSLLQMLLDVHAIQSANGQFRFKIPKGTKKALQLAHDLVETIDERAPGTVAFEEMATVMEIIGAYNSHFLRPVPLRKDLVVAAFTVLSQNVGVGKTPATNVLPTNQGDFSQSGPLKSSFWNGVGQLHNQNLFVGYGRTTNSFADLSNVCVFDEAKTGYGTRPGMTVKCGDNEYKLKWIQETHSEPTIARLFHGLGYNTPEVDYFSRLVVKYDRRIISEFNLRRSMDVGLTVLDLVKVANLSLGNPYVDPFFVIDSATLRDGTVVSPADLKRRLVKWSLPGDETKSENFNLDFENQIATIQFRPGSAEKKIKDSLSVGAWGWQDMGYFGDDETVPGSSMGHHNRRELRAVALIAAWLGLFDIRWDNNRLRLETNDSGQQVLRHYLSDLGSGLGSANNLIFHSINTVNDMDWDFTVSPRECLRARGAILKRCERYGFAITGYQPLEDNLTFRSMTLDDAKWAARLIAGLTESQIQDALLASGMTAAEIQLYLAKLVVRRDNMLIDLGLQSEISLLHPGFNPKNLTQTFSGHWVQLLTASGGSVRVPVGGCQIAEGKLVGCPQTLQPKDRPAIY